MAKDLFSGQACSYAGFRPGYPASLFEHILRFTPNRDTAWDCATGNGQAAVPLAAHFRRIFTTDISAAQLEHSSKANNIIYQLGSAEASGLADRSVDLVTVAQAYHWFNFDAFEREVRRVAKPGATIAIWGYGLVYTNNEALNERIQYLYTNVLGTYWDKERSLVDNHYASVPFPYQPLPSFDAVMQYTWNQHQFQGFFNSWSAVQHYKRQHSVDPVASWIESSLYLLDGPVDVFFPVFLKMGRIGPAG